MREKDAPANEPCRAGPHSGTGSNEEHLRAINEEHFRALENLRGAIPALTSDEVTEAIELMQKYTARVRSFTI